MRLGGGAVGDKENQPFHQPLELLRDELVPELCVIPLLQILKEKQKDGGGIGAEWEILDPMSEPVCTGWGRSWKAVGWGGVGGGCL